jgi:cytochrome c oxidase cbb3-type subunit 3
MSDHNDSSKNKSNEKDPMLLDHNYDGIEEYDNPLPLWWLLTFFGTIIFAFLYFIHYQFGGALSLADELKLAMDSLPKISEKQWNEADLKTDTDKPEMIAEGKAVFAGKCAACHGAEGQGVIGPNLTDKFWIQGKGDRVGIIQIVDKGVADKGMPSWNGLLTDKEIVSVVGYVYSLKGTNPANPKPAQGVEVQ